MFMAFVERDNDDIRHNLCFDKFAGQNALIRLRSKSLDSAIKELRNILIGEIQVDTHGNVNHSSKYMEYNDDRRFRKVTILDVTDRHLMDSDEWYMEAMIEKKEKEKEIHEGHERYEYEKLKKKYGNQNL